MASSDKQAVKSLHQLLVPLVVEQKMQTDPTQQELRHPITEEPSRYTPHNKRQLANKSTVHEVIKDNTAHHARFRDDERLLRSDNHF